jgi:hypothetical protein
MPEFFSLEAAQQQMGVVETLETTLATACAAAQAEGTAAGLRILTSEVTTRWRKWAHLLYLPVLGLTRPADLYYYQGAGLQVLCGFTYKYLPLEHFLGQLTRLQLGYPLAAALSRCYSQAWYPGATPLFIFTDWHDKPLWTKFAAHSGPMSMWGRVMPGTKQLLINGPAGHLLGGWDYVVDTCLPAVLVELEATLATYLGRPIAYTVCDSEGGGLPTGQRYAAAGRHYISVLPHQGYPLTAFTFRAAWLPVVEDPDHEAVAAQWADPQRAQADPRQLVLMRRIGDTDPTRVYAGCWPADWPAGSLPFRFRQRWANQERRIRELINGANLNANFGYMATWVPNRTQQRRWDAAQAKVEVTETQVAEQAAAVTNVSAQIAALQQATQETAQQMAQQMADQEAEVAQRQTHGQTWRRLAQGVARLRTTLAQFQAHAERRLARLQETLACHQARRTALKRELADRQAARDAIDTAGQCRERHLEKDQIMLDLQVLFASLHDWVRTHYLAPIWQRLELGTATELIYRKPGRVIWGAEQIEIIFEPYRYAAQQQAMEETCRRCNAAQLRWRDGRLLHFQGTSDPKLQLCDCQSAGQT